MVPAAGCALLALLLLAGALSPPPGALVCPEHVACTYIGGSRNEHQYKVEEKNIIIEHSDGSYINVKCEKSSVLESSALPRAVSELRVTKVALSGCPLPTAGSLADTLAALNVTLLATRDKLGKPLGTLKLTELPHAPLLSKQHFLRLENLLILHVSAAVTETVSGPKSGFLSSLRSLEVLMLQDVILPPGELDDPPPNLQTLSLKYTGVKQLPEALLKSTKLQTLTIASNSPLNAVAVPPGLLWLNLWSPATKQQLDAAPAFLGITVANWVEETPASLTQCGNLTSLQLTSPTVRVLPDGWLANCSRLEKLELQYAKNLTSLPENLLTNASRLTLLSFKQCALKTLPARFLDHVPQLSELHLFGNQLQTLSSSMFLVARGVRVLNLYSNELELHALDALHPLEHLRQLNLSNNPRISGLCDTRGKSPMSESTKLTYLNLRGTSVNKICSDWLSDMTELQMLDLSYTNVSELWFEDIQFKRTVENAVVMLKGAPVTVVGMTRADYNFAMGQTMSSSVQIKDLTNLACDCSMYWTRRALDAPNKPLRHVTGMRCAGGRPLEAMQPEEMVCSDNKMLQECAAAAPPASCSCGSRPDEDPRVSRVRVRVDCAGRGLRRVPRLHTAPEGNLRQYELLLSHNNITELDADSLRSDVIKLDLRNNNLETVSRETVTKLSSFGGELQLAGNPLDCSCSAVPLLRLFSSRGNFTNLKPATCKGGKPLTTAPQLDCVPIATWVACVIAAVLALTVATVLFLSSRERRFFIKAVFHRWGFLWYISDSEENDGRRYDAFVTFSHKDEPTVLELITRLEPTYRLCVHYRDWIPGRYITEQVVESVQDSRRTIALVSRHFLQSGWALAEFRQAHAAAMLEARPRLVVVLLEEPCELQLDEQLRRYLDTNTYVRWGDPWFWDKLALALPRPRPPVEMLNADGPHAPRKTPAGVRTSVASAPRDADAPRA